MLTGGSSNLPGIDSLARKIMPLPVRIGVPQKINGIGDMLQNPAYATSVGLLLWGAKNGPQSSWKPAGFTGSIKRLAFKLKTMFG